jgi:hypothetical protein
MQRGVLGSTIRCRMYETGEKGAASQCSAVGEMARMTGDDIGGEGGADHIHMTTPATHVRKTTEWWPKRRGRGEPDADGGGPAVVVDGHAASLPSRGRRRTSGGGERGLGADDGRRRSGSTGAHLGRGTKADLLFRLFTERSLCFSVKHSKAFLKLCNKLT